MGKKVSRKDDKGRVLRTGEYQRGDKTYSYSYVDPFGKRKYVYAPDIVTLRKKEDKLKRDQLDGLDVYTASHASLNFIFDRYINSKTDLRPTTRSNYKYMYDHLVRETFGKKIIGEIKYSDVVYFYNYLLDVKGIKIGTLDNVHSCLHPTFEMAVRDNIIRNNPSNGAMATVKKAPGRVKGVRHALTLEQQRSLLNYVETSPLFDKWFTPLTVLLGTGLRVGELLGLRWEDIDFDNRIISINHGLVYYTIEEDDERNCVSKISLPKTEAGIRTVPMMDKVYEVLWEEKERQRRKRIRCERIDGMTNFVFRSDTGKVLRAQQINEAIKRIIHYHNFEENEKAKEENREPLLLPDFSCHHLRHTFCTRFCENETNVKVIQSIMGHADIETTMNIYAEVTDSKKAESMNRLSSALDLF